MEERCWGWSAPLSIETQQQAKSCVVGLSLRYSEAHRRLRVARGDEEQSKPHQLSGGKFAYEFRFEIPLHSGRLWGAAKCSVEMRLRRCRPWRAGSADPGLQLEPANLTAR